MNYIIVGNSAAGISAAAALRGLDSRAEILVIDSDRNGAYARCRIPEVVSGEAGLAEILYRKEDFYNKKSITMIHDRVTRIVPEQRRLVTTGGREINYRKLLLATGSTPVRIKQEGAASENVYTLRNYADAAAIAQKAESSHRAIVLGGGLVGVKGALALRKRGMFRVTIAMKSSYLLSRQLNREAAKVLEEELKVNGISIDSGVDPKAFNALEGKIKSIGFNNGHERPTDMVLIAKGVHPCTELVGDAGGNVDKGIVVNDYLKTSLPHIYAAGDCIQVTDAITGNKVAAGLWPLAVEQGRYAALNMGGIKQKYPAPLTSMNAARFLDLPLIAIGPVNMMSEDMYTYGPKGKVYRRLVFRDGRLISAIFTGVVERAGVYGAIIKSGRKINAALRQRLIDGLVSAGDLLLSN